MLRNITYADSDISKYHTDAKDGIMGGETAPLTEAQLQILNYVQSQTRQSLRVTLKSIEEKFERKPFGWPSYAVLANTSALCGASKLEARSDGTILENDALIKSFKSNRDHQNIVLEPQVEYPASKVKDLKDFYAEFFTHQPAASDARGLSQETASEFARLASKLETLQQLSGTFPFLVQLSPIQLAFEGYAKKDVDWFIAELPKISDDILDQKDDALDPIINFMDGAQRQIYEQADQFLKDNQNNFNNVGSDKAKSLKAILIEEGCFKGNKMKEAKALLHDLRLLIDQGLMDARESATARLNSLQTDMHKMGDYQSANATKHATANRAFEVAIEEINSQRIIALIQVAVDRFTSDQYPSILGALVPPIVGSDPGDDGDVNTPPTVSQFVSAKTVSVAASKSVLDTEEDVDSYIRAFREALVQQIKDGKRITV